MQWPKSESLLRCHECCRYCSSYGQSRRYPRNRYCDSDGRNRDCNRHWRNRHCDRRHWRSRHCKAALALPPLRLAQADSQPPSQLATGATVAATMTLAATCVIDLLSSSSADTDSLDSTGTADSTGTGTLSAVPVSTSPPYACILSTDLIYEIRMGRAANARAGQKT